MTTTLDKPLKRQIAIDGIDYIVVVDPEAVRLTIKGRRKPEVELRWRDLVSGDAAMAVALNASLDARAGVVGKVVREKPPRPKPGAKTKAP